MEFRTLILEWKDNVGVITMNRPEQFNALNIELAEDLANALEQCIESSKVRAIILQGSGKAFCSGGDLKQSKEMLATGEASDYYRQLTKPLNRAIIEIRQSAKPVIAAINGATGGAGFSIAMACDLKVAASTAKFKLGYPTIGLCPDGGWTATVPSLTGLAKINEMIFLDEAMSAEEALSMGLINKVVPRDEVLRQALEWAIRAAAGPTVAYGIVKRLINESVMPSLYSQLEKERCGVVEAGFTKDHKEGLTAFFEKRLPEFLGK